ncbi:hypothetical protein KEM54_004682 [Ascosphaera aggregata]|nr:hypothetical protein KEM54_004682 [Ascosphaera aggregata]
MGLLKRVVVKCGHPVSMRDSRGLRSNAVVTSRRKSGTKRPTWATNSEGGRSIRVNSEIKPKSEKKRSQLELIRVE